MKPYFNNQEPNECGHYHPDVLLVKDFKKDGEYFRTLNCKYCGDFIVPLHSFQFNREYIQRLDDKESVIYLKSSEEIYFERNTLLELISMNKTA